MTLKGCTGSTPVPGTSSKENIQAIARNITPITLGFLRVYNSQQQFFPITGHFNRPVQKIEIDNEHFTLKKQPKSKRPYPNKNDSKLISSN